jgi:hypothetical protein
MIAHRIKRILGLSCSTVLLLGLAACSSTPRTPATVELFNGKNLNNWEFVSADPKVPNEKVWSVEKGLLTCQGAPVGAIYKAPVVANFRLVVEYRWMPGTKPGNSGIFSRITGPVKPLPPAVEVQLMHGNAGDVLGLQGRKVAAGQPRFFDIKAHPLAGDIAGVKKLTDLEKPAGEWNTVEIQALGSKYTVHINGQLANEVNGVEVVAGPVGLQSEGGVLQFRRVSLTSLD